MTEHVYLIPLGNLVSSDLTKSVAAFSNILANESYFPYLTTARIYSALLIDKVYYKTIDSYKLGEINTSEFKDKISYQLGIKQSDKFESAWNAMCELTEEAKENITIFFQHQQKEKFKISIISATNPLQYNYLISELNKELTENNLLEISKNPNVYIKTSFEEHNLSLSELAKLAIKENSWDSDDYHIISCDNRLTKESLMLDKAEFKHEENNWMSGLESINNDL